MVKIAHISDIHWRGISRHKEYINAFEALFSKLQKLNPDVIINTGDTFHTKTQGITPEIIEKLSWMFRSLAEIAPSYTILGNHDGNLLNSSRLDVITPIHTAINHKSAHLLRKSGVYKIEELEIPVYLCAFSPFDKKNWDKVKPVENAINIALYHGSVEQSQTDSGWILEVGHAEDNVSIFKDFDFAFLGDIHKQQFVGSRTVEMEVNEKELLSLQKKYGKSSIEILETIDG